MEIYSLIAIGTAIPLIGIIAKSKRIILFGCIYGISTVFTLLWVTLLGLSQQVELLETLPPVINFAPLLGTILVYLVAWER